MRSSRLNLTVGCVEVKTLTNLQEGFEGIVGIERGVLTVMWGKLKLVLLVL
jgi:hypothetical protein